MTTKSIFALCFCLLPYAFCLRASAQDTTFSYQGELNDGSSPATGIYELRFTIYDSTNNPGVVVAGPLTNAAVTVSNGQLRVLLDFGSAPFDGTARWLAIGVRTNGSVSAFQVLSPRQLLTSVPYAIRALNATSFTGAVSDVQLSGNIARLNGNQTFTGTVNFSSASNNFSGTFAGNGAGVTNLPFIAQNFGGLLAWPGKFIGAPTLPVGAFLGSIAVADVNGDGKPDLIAPANPLTVLTNNGNGGFSFGYNLSTVPNTPWFTLPLDLNNDGKVDLAVASQNQPGWITILTNNGSGGFPIASTNAVGDYPFSIATADFNGDGKPDLVSANYGSTTLSVLTNAANGAFALAASPVVGTNCYSVAAADVNGDGKPDVIAANWDAGALIVLTNNGNAGFVLAYSLPAGAQVISVIAADVNGDGKPDLISATYSGSTLMVFTNKGTTGFTFASSPTVGLRPYAVAAADVNGDGRPDLISANFMSQTLTVLSNKGNGSFASVATLPVGNSPRTVVAVDVNGDGEPDLIAANDTDESVNVFFNSPVLTGDAGGLTNFPSPLQIKTAGEGIRLQGQSNGVENLAYMTFFNGAGTRLGYVGDGGAGDNSIYLDADSGSVFLYTAAGAALTASSSGRVGIGTTSPQNLLHVYGPNAGQLLLQNSANGRSFNLYAESTGNLLFVPGPDGVFGYFRYTDGAWLNGSDERLKKDIIPLAGVLDRLLQLRPVSYEFRNAAEGAPRSLGLIAQEVEPLFPEVIGEHSGMKALAYSELVPVTIGAIQELNRKMESENAALREELKRSDAENAELKQRLDALEKIIRNHKPN